MKATVTNFSGAQVRSSEVKCNRQHERGQHRHVSFERPASKMIRAKTRQEDC